MAISDLKGSINAKIKTNGSQSITGAVLNEVLNEMVDELDVTSEINNKVDKELGKGLSTNDFTTSEKEKLAELQNYDDAELRGEVESLQTEVDSHDVAIEDLQDNKVDKGDYAPALTAGFADNLVSKDVVVDSEFNLRRSGGGAISDGVARMEVVKGNSVVWNQKLKYALSQADYGKQGWWCRYGEAQIEGRKVTFTGREGHVPFISQACDIVKGHAYLILFDFSAEYTDGYGRAYKFMFSNDVYGATTQTIYAPLDGLTNGHRVCFLTANNNYSYFIFRLSNDDLSSIPASTATLENYQLIDLTQMFGAGNEPTTIDEFYARKPIVEDEYAYNEGEVIHCNVNAVKSVGRNVWDDSDRELGDIGTSSTGGANMDGKGVWRTKGYISVLPNTKYYIYAEGLAQKSLRARFYRADLSYITTNDASGSGIYSAKEFTTRTEAAYMRLAPKEADVPFDTPICINLSDPDFNGQYEPYKEDVRELPSAIKEVFPNGMMSAGTAHDVAYNDLNKEVGVTEKRIGVVDLGTFPWYKNTDGYGRVLWKAVNLNNLGIVPNNNILCDRYVAQTKGTIYYDAVKGINVNSEANGMCFLYDPQYDDYDAASFKAAMAGVMLYYELAEPIVTEHQEPFNLDYQVTNGGQEQAMATEPTSAFKAEIAYGFNASAKIKENANEIASLKATIAQLQAALASMLSVTNNEIDNA